MSRLDDPQHRVDDDDVGDDQVERALRVGDAGSGHTVADGLAAAEDDLIAGSGGRAPPRRQLGVGQAKAVAGGRAVELGIVLSTDLRH